MQCISCPRASLGARQLRAVPARTSLRQFRRSPVKAMASAFYSLQAKNLEGQDVSFADAFKDKVVLITNVACFCGYTSGNYKELVELHNKYNSQGLEIVAFPCNQFGAQEPGSPAEIRDFVTQRGVQFTMMEKIDVNGPNTHPVYQYLKSACDSCGGDVRWNFAAKFVVDKQGNVVTRVSGDPKSVEPLIVDLLKQ